MRWLIFLLLASCGPAISKTPKTNKIESIDFVFKVEKYKYGVLQGNATAFSVKTINGSTFILTNRHVCHERSDAEYVLVDKQYRRYDAKYYQNHMFADLCLLRVNATLPTVEFVSPEFDERVTVISAPHGAFPIFENGIIKQPVVINSSIEGESYYFQAQVIKVNTDEGSSGSPVFNSDQRVVGILFGTADGNYSYMVPSVIARKFVEHITD